MSRSMRKSPFAGRAAESDKWAKQKANRALRRSVHISLTSGDEYPLLPAIEEIFNRYDFPKDGKMRLLLDEEPDDAKRMRK